MNEHKKGVRAKKLRVASIEPSKPRNFVAKNAINAGAGAHKDKKKAMKQGDTKHKKLDYAESLELRLAQKLSEEKVDEFLPALARVAAGAVISKALDSDDETEEDVNSPEYNDEAGMSHNSIHTIMRAAKGLESTIKEGDNLPEWCQEKLSIAEDYLVTVWDYLQSEQSVAEGSLELNTPDPVVVVQDLKGNILDKINLSVAVQKYKLGAAQNIKNQLAHQNYTTIGNYVIVSPMSGQPQDATTQGVAEGLPQTLRKVVPGHAKREIDKKMDAGKFGKTDADKDANFQRYKKIQDKLKEQGVAEGNDEEDYYYVVRYQSKRDIETEMPKRAWDAVGPKYATYEEAKAVFDQLKAKHPQEKFTYTRHPRISNMGGTPKQVFPEGWSQKYKNCVPNESVEEKLNLKAMDTGAVIKDFEKSNAPQFRGKTKEKRRQMAIAAKMGAMKKKKKIGESVEEWTTDSLASHLFEQELTYEDRLNNMLSKKLSK